MSIIYFRSGASSYSGAYLFAPFFDEEELSLQVVDCAFTIVKRLESEITIIYRTMRSYDKFITMKIKISHADHQRNLEISAELDNSNSVFAHSDFFLKTKFSFEDENASNADTRFYIYDTVNHVRKDHIKRKVFSNRDLGSKIFSAPGGAAYHYNNYLLSFFSTKVLGVGYMGDGTFLFGMGRHNIVDDGKGLPGGTPDVSTWNFMLHINLFKKEEILSQTHLKYWQLLHAPSLAVFDDQNLLLHNNQELGISEFAAPETIRDFINASIPLNVSTSFLEETDACPNTVLRILNTNQFADPQLDLSFIVAILVKTTSKSEDLSTCLRSA